MALTTEGVKFLAQAVVGIGVPFNADNAYIGVGNGTDDFLPSQTDLAGSETARRGMDSGYPAISAPTVYFKATFPPEEANFAWNEWGIFNAETGGVMLTRTVESNGIKQNNQTWIFEVSVTFETNA